MAADAGGSFEWSDDFNASLEKIAETDEVDLEWAKLKNIIKHKVNENITSFLADSQKLKEAFETVPTFSKDATTPGGLRMPPFPPREPRDPTPLEVPKLFLSETEADEVKGTIYEQLDSFDDTPFTIQRLAELCVHPRANYTTLGKYLRALERVIYVTSSWKSFPPLPPQPAPISTSIGQTPIMSTDSAPSTPLFSPIPFLHEDARRSKSRSPPPLTLSGDPASGVPIDGAERVLGLVDELDDPGPGHLSDKPTPISSATSTDPPAAGLFSLETRFVKAKEEKAGEEKKDDGTGTEPPLKKPKTEEEEKSEPVEKEVVMEIEGQENKENKT